MPDLDFDSIDRDNRIIDAVTAALTATACLPDTAGSVRQLTSADECALIGQLMTSALQSPSFIREVETGRYAVWAVVDGADSIMYLVGINLYARTPNRIQQAFGPGNRTSNERLEAAVDAALAAFAGTSPAP